MLRCGVFLGEPAGNGCAMCAWGFFFFKGIIVFRCEWLVSGTSGSGWI